MVFIYWLPAMLWAGLIFYLSGRTGGELHSLFPFFTSFDWGHLVAYFVLGFLVYFAIRKTRSVKHPVLVTVLLCLLYGISDEIHQLYVPGRTFQLIDLVNDVFGAALGGFCFYLLANKNRQEKIESH